MNNGSGKNTYEDNVYEMLKRRGLAKKYEHPGIYSISIDDQLVYIGKSVNMLRRVAQHYVGIQKEKERKYRILAEAKRHGYSINFDVLYYAAGNTHPSIIEEIGYKEGEYIREHLPALNYQIPKADDWHRFETNAKSTEITLSEIMKEKNDGQRNERILPQ